MQRLPGLHALLCRDLADHTNGLRWVLERVAGAQQRSEAALALLLGRTWGAEDLAFYAAAAGAQPSCLGQAHRTVSCDLLPCKGREKGVGCKPQWVCLPSRFPWQGSARVRQSQVVSHKWR